MQISNHYITEGSYLLQQKCVALPLLYDKLQIGWGVCVQTDRCSGGFTLELAGSWYWTLQIKADPSGRSRLHHGLLLTPLAKMLRTRLQSHFGRTGPALPVLGGASAYPRKWDPSSFYSKFEQVGNKFESSIAALVLTISLIPVAVLLQQVTEGNILILKIKISYFTMKQ